MQSGSFNTLRTPQYKENKTKQQNKGHRESIVLEINIFLKVNLKYKEKINQL